MSRARILYCEGNIDGTIGGSYYSLLYLIEGLDRARYEPLLILHRDSAMRPRFEAAGAEVRILERPRPVRVPGRASTLCRRYPALCAPLAVAQSALNFFRFNLYVLALARLLRRERIDLVHLNNSITSNHHWMLAAVLTRTPCITHERGVNHRFTRLARWLAPRLAAIVCISKASHDALVQHRIVNARLEVIQNGLDPARIVPRRSAAEVRAAFGLPETGAIIGLLGNIRRWKGQEVLVRALPAIVRSCPGVTCVFVGEATAGDREYEARLQALIDELGVRRHVVFAGFQANVADALSVMDVAVHASITPEPFGRVLLEAMAMKKPVVGSRDGGVLEIVVEGQTGLTFAPGNADELAAQVVALLQDPARARAFGQAGYERIVAEFHIARNVERTMAMYQRVLAA
jgi:glycosyltransferase involved in cell wall biosynthesis